MSHKLQIPILLYITFTFCSACTQDRSIKKATLDTDNYVYFLFVGNAKSRSPASDTTSSESQKSQAPAVQQTAEPGPYDGLWSTDRQHCPTSEPTEFAKQAIKSSNFLGQLSLQNGKLTFSGKARGCKFEVSADYIIDGSIISSPAKRTVKQKCPGQKELVQEFKSESSTIRIVKRPTGEPELHLEVHANAPVCSNGEMGFYVFRRMPMG